MPLFRNTMDFALDGLPFTFPKYSSISSFETGALGKNLDNLVMKTSFDKGC